MGHFVTKIKYKFPVNVMNNDKVCIVYPPDDRSIANDGCVSNVSSHTSVCM